MAIALVCALSLVLAVLALAGLALRYEHLVVLYLPRVAPFFLERREGGRYVVVSPLWVPVTALRFAAHAVSLAPSAARRAGARAALPLTLRLRSHAPGGRVRRVGVAWRGSSGQ